jgi:amidohydrolase
MTDMDPKQVARDRVQRAHSALVGLSHWIHDHPEVGDQETLASGVVADWLEKAGFTVERGLGGLPTAVSGSFGTGPLHVALLAEYDALPDVGHACGHNVIAATAIGAGVALAGVADRVGLRVSVIGTPAEEGGGGKIRLLDAGAFEGVHLALMVHPGPSDLLEPHVLAAEQLEVMYHGRTSHAAAFPERGINAGDALVVAQVAIGLLRQRLRPSDRIHSMVTRGGEAPNVIPELASAAIMIRAATLDDMAVVRDEVMKCLEAGATATGATLEVKTKPAYREMRHDIQLADLYQLHAESLGRSFERQGRVVFTNFSSDIGNLSQVIPSIHPIIGIDSGDAVNHQPEFAEAAVGEAADQAILDGAVALAWTAIDAATKPELRDRLLAGTGPRSAGAKGQGAKPA